MSDDDTLTDIIDYITADMKKKLIEITVFAT